MDKDFYRIFDSCPNCGSTDRFCEQLGQELKDMKLAREEWNFCYDMRQGVVQDQQRTGQLLIVGQTLPGFLVKLDICMDCGTVYAVFLQRLEGKTQAMTPEQIEQIKKLRAREKRGNGGGHLKAG